MKQLLKNLDFFGGQEVLCKMPNRVDTDRIFSNRKHHSMCPAVPETNPQFLEVKCELIGFTCRRVLFRIDCKSGNCRFNAA